MKQHLGIVIAIGGSALALSVAAGEYDGYVSLSSSDDPVKYWVSSWKSAGQWSDGAAPHSDADYYVAPGIQLNAQDAGKWGGGRLVLGGTLLHCSAKTAGVCAEGMVLLAGSEVKCLSMGGFSQNGDTIGTVTVSGTADAPAVVSLHYKSYGDWYLTSDYIDSLGAKFTGTSDSVLTLTRPAVNYNGEATAYGFFFHPHDYTFLDYPGTVKVSGDQTVLRGVPGGCINMPQATLAVEEGARVELSYRGGDFATNPNMFVGSLDVRNGTLAYCRDQSSGAVYPTVNVNGRLSLGDGARIVIPAEMKGIGSGAHFAKLAHLAAGAEQDSAGVPAFWVGADAVRIYRGMRLNPVDAGNGSQDLYLDVVTMDKANQESGDGMYGAFNGGHDGDFSNGETPSSDSTLNYLTTAKLCNFASVDLPDATLTFGSDFSWKAGPLFRFKNIGCVVGMNLGFWGPDAKRTLEAENFFLPDPETCSSPTVTFYVFQDLTVDLKAAVHGAGEAVLRLRNEGGGLGTVNLCGDNSDFHGQIVVYQTKTDAGVIEPCSLKMTISDARNLGGRYMGPSSYDAIHLEDGPKLVIADSVALNESTRSIFVNRGAMFEVAKDKVMSVSSQITYRGQVVKSGAGTLELAGTTRFGWGNRDVPPSPLEVEGENRLRIDQGTLKVSSHAAIDGLEVVFAKGTDLCLNAVPSSTEMSATGFLSTKSGSSLVGDGPIRLRFDFPDGFQPGSGFEVPICTVPAAAAQGLDFAPVKHFGMKGRIDRRTNDADGSVTFVAVYEVKGSILILR